MPRHPNRIPKGPSNQAAVPVSGTEMASRKRQAGIGMDPNMPLAPQMPRVPAAAPQRPAPRPAARARPQARPARPAAPQRMMPGREGVMVTRPPTVAPAATGYQMLQGMPHPDLVAMNQTMGISNLSDLGRAQQMTGAAPIARPAGGLGQRITEGLPTPVARQITAAGFDPALLDTAREHTTPLYGITYWTEDEMEEEYQKYLDGGGTDSYEDWKQGFNKHPDGNYTSKGMSPEAGAMGHNDTTAYNEEMIASGAYGFSGEGYEEEEEEDYGFASEGQMPHWWKQKYGDKEPGDPGTPGAAVESDADRFMEDIQEGTQPFHQEKAEAAADDLGSQQKDLEEGKLEIAIKKGEAEQELEAEGATAYQSAMADTDRQFAMMGMLGSSNHMLANNALAVEVFRGLMDKRSELNEFYDSQTFRLTEEHIKQIDKDFQEMSDNLLEALRIETDAFAISEQSELAWNDLLITSLTAYDDMIGGGMLSFIQSFENLSDASKAIHGKEIFAFAAEFFGCVGGNVSNIPACAEEYSDAAAALSEKMATGEAGGGEAGTPHK